MSSKPWKRHAFIVGSFDSDCIGKTHPGARTSAVSGNRLNQAAITSRRQNDLGHVNVAVRIDADVVRGEEVSGSAGIRAAAPSRQQPTLAIEDTHAPARGIGTRGDVPGHIPARNPSSATKTFSASSMKTWHGRATSVHSRRYVPSGEKS